MRQKLKKLAPNVSRIFKHKNGNSGYCPICEKEVFFEIKGSWLRDQYLCSDCNSIPRWRAMMEVMNDLYPDWRSKCIHESSPCGALSEKLSRECREYIATYFFKGVQSGIIWNQFQCEDLARQTFSDNRFDIVLTSDVLEHLQEPQLSIAEITRTLKPGGAHIFTVPWYYWKETLIRAELGKNEIMNLHSPEYHGNPIDQMGALVVTEWGRELPFMISEWTGLPTIVIRIYDKMKGIDGKFIEVFVSKKPA